MGPKDIIRGVAKSNDFIVNTYLADLSDADLLTRPVEGANHIAWQLGHLIQAEQSLLKDASASAKPIELPAGWDKLHSADGGRVNPPAGYATKADYLALYKKSRENVLKALDATSEADLAKPTQGRLAQFAPTIADMFVLIANHPMMHVGQWVVLRRKLGKPVVI
jgi:hypothetical protein